MAHHRRVKLRLVDLVDIPLTWYDNIWGPATDVTVPSHRRWGETKCFEGVGRDARRRLAMRKPGHTGPPTVKFAAHGPSASA